MQGARLLHALAGDVAPETNIVGVVEGVDRDEGRAGWTEARKALAQAELGWGTGELDVSVRDVLSEHKAGNHLPGVGRCDR